MVGFIFVHIQIYFTMIDWSDFCHLLLMCYYYNSSIVVLFLILSKLILQIGCFFFIIFILPKSIILIFDLYIFEFENGCFFKFESFLLIKEPQELSWIQSIRKNSRCDQQCQEYSTLEEVFRHKMGHCA